MFYVLSPRRLPPPSSPSQVVGPPGQQLDRAVGLFANQSASARRVDAKRRHWSRRVPTAYRPVCDRVTSQKAVYDSPSKNNGAREHGVSDCATNWTLQYASKRDIFLIYVCCKKWTCPPDNHARTFDMSGDILTCLGHTDWHYFEP